MCPSYEGDAGIPEYASIISNIKHFVNRCRQNSREERLVMNLKIGIL